MLDQDRQEKTLSLNLARRQQQRTQQDQMRLTDENQRRMADGLMPVKAVSDINAANEPDVILAQAAAIMADETATRAAGRNDPQVVRRQAPVSANP
jgi:hypothetical protein